MGKGIRNRFFWLLDTLRGSPVRHHVRAIEKINADHSAEAATRMRGKYLSDLLDHSRRTVPYYRELERNPQALQEFPVINKNVVRENFERFRSQTYAESNTYEVSTSGSTGTPFRLLHDAGKRKRHTADTLYFGNAVGHSLGDRVYYFKIWNSDNSKSKLLQYVQNIVPIHVFKLTDTRIAALLHRLERDSSTKSLLGYASALDALAGYLERQGDAAPRATIRSVISMSEPLAGPTKEKLASWYDCPVVSRYANLENGILAQQTIASPDLFLMNLASYEIEILEMDRDLPVREGEMGRIVVTDLFNRAMPLIRYDTGDLGMAASVATNGNVQYVLKKIEGRRLDAVYDTRGDLISSYTFVNNMWKYRELKQYQFIQHGIKQYEFQLSTYQDFQREEELLREFRGYLGEDAEIRVTYVDEIPLLASGKRRRVVNLMVDS